MVFLLKNIGGWFWRHIYPILSLIIYQFIDLTASNSKIHRWKADRLSIDSDDITVNETTSKHILILCPSLGEYESIKDIIRRIRASDDNVFIEVAFFSPSGFRPLTSHLDHVADLITYSPPDTKKCIHKFFAKRNVNEVIISSLSIWPNFLQYLIQHRIPFSFVAVRIKKGLHKKIYYHSLSYLLDQSKQIFCMDEFSYLWLSQTLSGSRISKTGNPRIDSILFDLKHPPNTTGKLRLFKKDKPLLILGSTHLEDEKMIFPLLKRQLNYWNILIAPHDLDRLDVILRQINGAKLFSEYNEGDNTSILILDSIGLLKYCYPYAEVSYMGGGFSQGLHNIEEPILAGSVVIVGRKTEASQMANLLLSKKALLQIDNASDFLNSLNFLLIEKNRINVKMTASAIINEMSGASALITSKLELKQSS